MAPRAPTAAQLTAAAKKAEKAAELAAKAALNSGKKASIMTIPTSRIKTYINDNIVNKDVLDVLFKLETAKTQSTPLDQVLTDEQRELVGTYIAETEAKEAKKTDEGKEVKKPLSDLDEYDVAIAAITRTKLKFSKTSFQVIAVAMDKILYDLSNATMDNMLANSTQSNSNITLAYVVADEASIVYPIYANSVLLKNVAKSKEELAAETAEDDEKDTSTPTSVNFECYIKKIVDKVRESDFTKYAAFKNSTPYKRFCSAFVLELLDRIANLIMVVANSLQLKTISDKIIFMVFDMVIADHTGVVDTENVFYDFINKTLTDVANEAALKKKAKK